MMAMDNSDQLTAIQRIVLAAAQLHTFSRSELSDKAGTKPSTTRVVLKRLRDKWPNAIAVEASETKQGKAGGFNRYTVTKQFVIIEQKYGKMECQKVRESSTETVVSEFIELANNYLKLARKAERHSLDQEAFLAKSDLFLSQSNFSEAAEFPELKSRFLELRSELERFRSDKISPRSSTKRQEKSNVVEAPRLVRMKSVKQRSPQKRIEERIREFCSAFASFDLSVLAFEKVIYPVFSEMMDRASIRNFAGSVTEDMIAGDIWNRQLQINTTIKSNIRRNVIAHLMSDDAEGKAVYETIVVRDGSESETLQTAMDISKAWLEGPGRKQHTKLAWRVNEHRLGLPAALTSPAWYTYFRSAISNNYFRASNHWIQLLDNDLHQKPLFWDYEVRGLDQDAKASAALALLTLTELGPFNRATLQHCVRNSMVHSLGAAYARPHGEYDLPTQALYGHSASILVDQSADPLIAKSISARLQTEGIMSSFTPLDLLDPKPSTFVGSAQEFSPTMLVVAIDSSRIRPDTLAIIENLQNSSCVFLDLSSTPSSILPIDQSRVVRSSSPDKFEVRPVVEAATDAISSAPAEDFELYGPAKLT